MSKVAFVSPVSRTLFFTAWLQYLAIGTPRQVAADAFQDLETVAQSYSIEIVTADPQFPIQLRAGSIDGKFAERPLIEKYVDLFVPEFTLFPPSLIQRSKLKRVVLCKDLSFAGQLRNAIPDFGNDTLYLDVRRGASRKSYLRKVIHHEFFHIVDYRDDGSLYKDERWKGLNPPEFQYGAGGRNSQHLPSTSVLTDKLPGFLNHYSTTGVEEDKAEVFANLMVDPVYVAERAAHDPVLQAKVAQMRELLTKFCPEMQEEFWDKVRQVKRMD